MSPELATAIVAARKAGGLLRTHFGSSLVVNEMEAHDIKLELDVRAQRLIEEVLLSAFPSHALYGEEGIGGNIGSENQWIVDPIDGTVNFFYGYPHFCISIALRCGEHIELGVIYDPMRDEMWTARRGGPAFLNDKPIHVSNRDKLGDAIVTVGFSKSEASINRGVPLFEKMVRKCRKCRMMGSAALDMAYIASGRLDAYVEHNISLWDIAAGMVLIESAGGKVRLTAHEDAKDKYSIVAWNGSLPVEQEIASIP